MIKILMKKQKTFRILIKLLELWLTYNLRWLWIIFIYYLFGCLFIYLFIYLSSEIIYPLIYTLRLNLDLIDKWCRDYSFQTKTRFYWFYFILFCLTQLISIFWEKRNSQKPLQPECINTKSKYSSYQVPFRK